MKVRRNCSHLSSDSLKNKCFDFLLSGVDPDTVEYGSIKSVGE